MTVVADRYRLDQLLGSGGVADVHRARDLVLDRDVAVKVLRESVDDSDRDRFVGEAKLLARLSHPGLVSVLDAGVSESQPFLVMELVEGSTLATALREGPLSAERVADIGSELALAIAYAHEQQVVHRDVKPANVLLGPAGPKLADFGIARLVGDTARHTRTGTTIGTPAYVSPEQVRGEQVGPPTDVYSLGLVLLEALTGTRAFTGTPVETALARLHRSPEIPDHLPPRWRELLAAMTATSPDDRPSAAETAAQIHGAGATPAETRVLGVPAAPAVPAVPAVAPMTSDDEAQTERMDTAPGPVPHRSSRIVAVAAATGVVLAAVAVAAVVLDDGTSDGGPGPTGTSSVTASDTGPSEDDATAPPEDQGQDETTATDEGEQGGDGAGKGDGEDKAEDKGKNDGKGKGGKNKGGKGGKG